MPVYRITSLPDPSHTTLQLRFGDVRKSVFSGWKSLLRMIAEMEPGSISVSICYHYLPSLERGVQGRLQAWLVIDNQNRDLADALIFNGPLSDFYFQKKPDIPAVEPILLDSSFHAGGEILRRIELISSYLTREQNNRIPGKPYNALIPFSAIEDNDFLQLDLLLSGLKHEVYFEVLVRPVRISDELMNIYQEIHQLSDVNESVWTEKSSSFEDSFRKEHGFIKDHLAENLLREFEEFATNCRQPQLQFTLRILGYSAEEVRLAASVIAESAFGEGKYRILIAEKGSEAFSYLLEDVKNRNIDHSWQHSTKVKESLKMFARIAGIDELNGIFRLPVASNTSPKTIRKATDPERKDVDRFGNRIPNILIGDDMETGESDRTIIGSLGNLFDTASMNCIEHRLPLELLKKHMFICGVPGSGKTTAIFNLLVQLHRLGIPFLIIEPAKTEYRILKRLAEHQTDPELRQLGANLRIYTPGSENISPFRFNPFSYPDGISLDEHLNNLMNCFKSAMNIPNDSPLPALLSRAVEEVYDGFAENEFPFMEDLVRKVKDLMDSPDLAYDSEIKGNLKTAIEVRLSPLVSKKRSIGKIFSKDDYAPPIHELMENPVLIEMDALDTEQANLLTLFLLTSVREYIKTTRRSGSHLTHVIVLEEAHNVVGNIPESAEPDDPRKKAADYISRMLAELRALGEGIIIADQLPSTVASTVIKNTGTKLAHRLTSKDDREEIAFTMLLGSSEIEEFARLQVGEAFYYTEGLYRPRRIKCLNSNELLGFSTNNAQPPDTMELYDLIECDSWFRARAEKILMIDVNRFHDYLDAKDEALLSLKTELLNILDAAGVKKEDEKLLLSHGTAAAVRKDLAKLYETVETHCKALGESASFVERFPLRQQMLFVSDSKAEELCTSALLRYLTLSDKYKILHNRIVVYFNNIDQGGTGE